MDKKIEDYLHLYLGCECEFKTVETQKLFSRKLIGIDIDYLFQPAYDRNPVYEYIKPTLRPLSDMTEEDVNSICSIIMGKEITCIGIDFTPERDFVIACFNIEKCTIDERFDTIEMGIQINSDFEVEYVWNYRNKHGIRASTQKLYNHNELTKYLLSKGFDLFGLIESNLAISKVSNPLKTE